MNNKFLINLNSFQNTAIKNLLSYKKNKIIICSNKFTGKTMLIKKLFNSSNDEVIIYHTGCCPELFNRAKEELIKIINKYKSKSITFMSDEFYDDELLDFINKPNISAYIFTNDMSLKKSDYLIFNYYIFYNKFIKNEIGEYKNLHQILNKDKDFDIKNERLRHVSKSTITYVNYKNVINEYKMEI